MIKALLAVLAVTLPVAVQAEPQAPFAAGPFESIIEVIRQAHHCRITKIRLEIGLSWGGKPPEVARVYYNEDYARSTAPRVCLDDWLTKSGRRLRLEPRWNGDDFTTTWPQPRKRGL